MSEANEMGLNVTPKAINAINAINAMSAMSARLEADQVSSWI